MRDRTLVLAVAALAFAPAGLAGAQAVAPPASPVKQSAQQMFEAAADAALAGDHAKAVELLTMLEQRTKNPRSIAIFGVRRGVSLVELGRADEARPTLEKALAALPADDKSLDIDRGQGLIALGGIALNDLDYDGALSAYGLASAVAVDPVGRINVLIGAAQAGVFVDAAQALARAQEAETLAAALPPSSPTLAGHIAAIKGRALLNLGRFAEAEEAFAKTVSAEGGLSMKVDYADLVSRSDASIAAMLAGHRDKARNYLLYTGAGRMAKQDFTAGAEMTLPVCGEDGIRPDDVAVVEFAIADDGAVPFARPVYGSRQGSMALVFARAVRGWSWRPEDVAKIPALFRMVTRLELRCSSGEGGPSLREPAQRAFRAWADERGAPSFDPPGVGEAQRQAGLRGELARIRATAGDNAIALAPVLGLLLDSPLTAAPQISEYGALLRPIVAGNRPTPLARLYVDLLTVARTGRRVLGDILPPDDGYRDDPEALATVQLIRYDAQRPRDKQRSIPILDRIIADPALPADHPLHVAALIRRASARAAGKDIEGAHADFMATGLTTQQCSVVDARPNLKSAPTSNADYPMDMLRVGVEGWAGIQFDVAANGRTLNQRAVISYPPMIFSDNGVEVVAHARFEQSYRPDGGLGCSGSGTVVHFKMPG